MKQKIALLLSAALLITTPFASFAEDVPVAADTAETAPVTEESTAVATDSRHYIKGGLGYSLSGKTEFTMGGASGTEDLDNMIFFPVLFAYGYNFNDMFALEGEFTTRTNNYDSNAITSSMNTTNLAVNGVANFTMDKLSAFVGVGVAYGLYKFGQDTETGNGLGAQGFVGVDYRVPSGVRLGLEYRYFQTIADIDIGSGIDASYQNHAVIVSAKFAL